MVDQDKRIALLFACNVGKKQEVSYVTMLGVVVLRRTFLPVASHNIRIAHEELREGVYEEAKRLSDLAVSRGKKRV